MTSKQQSRFLAGRDWRTIAALVLLTVSGACSSPGPTGEASDHETTRELTFGHLVLAYPASWRLTEPDFVTSFSSIDAYLSTIPVPDPCHPIPNGMECSGSAYQLAPGSLVVTVGSEYMHGPGEEVLPLTIAGMPAAFERVDPPPNTLASARLQWRIATGPSAWHVITADVRGPGTDRMIEQVTRMIDSLRFEPAVQPLPVDPDERAAAAERILVLTLNRLAADSAAYRCFPRVPGRAIPSILSQLPMGPVLTEAVPVICSSRVDATRYQMWKVTLTIQFSDPNNGDGPIVTEQWVASDGALGQLTQRSGGPVP